MSNKASLETRGNAGLLSELDRSLDWHLTHLFSEKDSKALGKPPNPIVREPLWCCGSLPLKRSTNKIRGRPLRQKMRVESGAWVVDNRDS